MIKGAARINNIVLTLTLLTLSCFVLLSGCDDENKEANLNRDPELVSTSTSQWTGIAVSNTTRIFVNYPNWSATHAVSVAELNNGQLSAYPNADWNTWSEGLNPEEHFICVQSVFVDHTNTLWILDPANPQRNGEYLGVVKGGAKLIGIDLQSNTITTKIVFSAPVIKENSYLNDIRIDENKKIGYITDSNEGAIIVVNLETGVARRVLSADPSTKSENEVLEVEGNVYRNPQGELPVIHSDGIALSPDRNFLYWRALTGKSLYRIPTASLNDPAAEAMLGSKVENLGNFPPSDGIIFAMDGKLYLTSIEENAVRVYNDADQTTQLVVRSNDLKWPDSFAVGPDGAIYVTTSQIHLPQPTDPYKIYKFQP